MLDSFLKYLEFEKRCSPHTLLSYRNDLTSFSKFLQTDSHSSDFPISLESAATSEVRAWLYALTEEGLSPRSVNRKIAALRSFYRFCNRISPGSSNPMESIRALKTNTRLPAFITEGEMMRMLEHLEFPEDFNGHRDRLILELFYGTGMRLSELIHTKETDISLSQRTIRVFGKRAKERIIPIPQGIIPSIVRYLEARKDLIQGQSVERLFLTEQGEPLYPMLVYRKVQRYLSQFTTSEKKSPHVLRHTFATHLLNNGADLNAVKDLLGHANLAATQVYTHNSVEKLKSVYDKAHPKA